jgi:hypothetical protein
MDSLVNKIIAAAKKEAPSAHDCQQALIRAGLIAHAYVGAESEVIAEVFGLSADLMLHNDVNRDPVTTTDRSH